MELTKTLETSVKRLFNKLTLTALLSSSILASCQQAQPKPEKPLVVYEFIGTVKGESRGEYSTTEVTLVIDPNTGGHKQVWGKGNAPEYSFILETEHGLKTFRTTISTTELDALINPGDKIKVHYFNNWYGSNESEYSTRFNTEFVIREVNNKRIDLFTRPMTDEQLTRINNARIVKIE